MCLFLFRVLSFWGWKNMRMAKKLWLKTRKSLCKKKNQKNKIKTHTLTNIFVSINTKCSAIFVSINATFYASPPSPLTDLAAERRCHASVFVTESPNFHPLKQVVFLNTSYIPGGFQPKPILKKKMVILCLDCLKLNLVIFCPYCHHVILSDDWNVL